MRKGGWASGDRHDRREEREAERQEVGVGRVAL